MQEANTNNEWSWVGRYVAVIIVSIILAAAIGNMDLFVKANLGKLSASKLVQFLGYGAALAAFWVLGQRATVAMQQHQGRWSFMQHLLLPVVSLIVVALAYSVLLLVLRPMLDASLLNIYNWLFVLVILACAGWLVMAVLNQSASLTELFTERVAAAHTRVCASCGARCGKNEKFCSHCGKALS